MSEPQANYETDETQPTPGPGEAEGRYVVAYPNDARPNGEIILGPTSRGNDLPGPEQRANAELSAAAFSAASELPDEYDAVKVLEMLPKLIRAVDGLPRELLRRQIARVTPDADGIIKNLNAARGHTDE